MGILDAMAEHLDAIIAGSFAILGTGAGFAVSSIDGVLARRRQRAEAISYVFSVLKKSSEHLYLLHFSATSIAKLSETTHGLDLEKIREAIKYINSVLIAAMPHKHEYSSDEYSKALTQIALRNPLFANRARGLDRAVESISESRKTVEDVNLNFPDSNAVKNKLLALDVLAARLRYSVKLVDTLLNQAADLRGEIVRFALWHEIAKGRRAADDETLDLVLSSASADVRRVILQLHNEWMQEWRREWQRR